MDFESGASASDRKKRESYGHSYKAYGDNWKDERDREKRIKLDKDKEKYSKGFQEKALNLDTVGPERYTREQRDEDHEYITAWRDFEIGRIHWLKDELSEVFNKRFDLASNREQKEPILNWYQKELDALNNEMREVHAKYQTKRERVFNSFFTRHDTKKQQEEMRRKMDEERARRDAERKNQEAEREKQRRNQEAENEKRRRERENTDRDSRNPGQEKRPEQGRENEIQGIALRELNITRQEQQMIESTSRLSDPELQILISRILKVSDFTDKSAVKRAYSKCAREWHPDKAKEQGERGRINEIKFKLVAGLYTKYKSRMQN